MLGNGILQLGRKPVFLELPWTEIKFMDSTRIFQSGVEGSEALAMHFGNDILTVPLLNDSGAMVDVALNAFEPGFQINRDQPANQARGVTTLFLLPAQ